MIRCVKVAYNAQNRGSQPDTHSNAAATHLQLLRLGLGLACGVVRLVGLRPQLADLLHHLLQLVAQWVAQRVGEEVREGVGGWVGGGWASK